MKASSVRICLTPEKEFYLIGYGNRYASRRQPAKGVHDDIYAICSLIEVDNQQLYIFNADYIEFEEASCNEIKAMLAQKYQLNPDLIFFSATHDHHSVMSYHKHWSTGIFDQRYYDSFVQKVEAGYLQCVEELQESEAYYGRGQCLGYYGSRIYYGEEADNEVILVEFRNAEQKTVAALCNWATHSTVLDPENDLLTADLAGAVRNKLAAGIGVYPAMIVGAAGDCSNRAYRQGTDYEELERCAEGCAQQILKIEVNQKLDLHFESCSTVTYHVQYKINDEREYLNTYREKYSLQLDAAQDAQARKLALDNIAQIDRKLQMQDVDLTLYSTIVKCNDLEIVSSPGELGSELGISIKRRSPAKCCLIFGYTNGYYSYILQPGLYQDSARAVGSKYRKEDVLGYMNVIEANL